MRILENLEPARVFYYFEEISKIPHGSGNTKEISDYLVEFAKKHSLKYIQDDINNVIIFKEASEGYEDRGAVIIQGHMDMVSIKEDWCALDLKKDALELYIDGDWVSAKGTTLGADNGVAVAYVLALLESDEYKHPKLEIIITVEEEVGMDGAKLIDVSMLEGKKFINIDSGEEGTILTSCAGGGRFRAKLSLNRGKRDGVLVDISISGLQGGHSGVEIDKGRANACYEIIRMLYIFTKKIDMSLLEANGGGVDNVIPSNATISVVIKKEDLGLLEAEVNAFHKLLQNEYCGKEDGILISFETRGESQYAVVNDEDIDKMCSLVLNLPNGVQSMSGTISGLVETSLNLGIMKIDESGICIDYAVRSSVESKKIELVEKMTLLTKLYGGEVETKSFYPAWQYRQDSQLRDDFVKAYKENLGVEPEIEAVHAGLECGFFAGKIADLDCISYGPDLEEIHSTNEKMCISSTQRMWKILLKVLEIC